MFVGHGPQNSHQVRKLSHTSHIIILTCECLGQIPRSISPHTRSQPAGVDAEHVALHDLRGIGHLSGMLGDGHVDRDQQTDLHFSARSVRTETSHAGR